MSEEYEVEKIIDHISYVDAFEQYFKYQDKRYASIFLNWNRIKKKKTHTFCKYFFLVKWLNFRCDEMTWEPEENVPLPVYLREYKRINNLSSKLIHQKMSLFFTENRKEYYPPKVLNEIVVNQKCPLDVLMNKFTITLNDDKNNGKFGIVPVPNYKRKCMQRIPYLKKGNKLFIIQENIIDKPETKTVAAIVKQAQTADRSFLQMMIRHPHIVKIRDMFMTNLGDAVKITKISDYCHQTLLEKVKQEKTVNWKRVCRDMLNAFTFIHKNGIHQAVSLENIHFTSKKVFQLTNFKNFYFAGTIPMDKVKSEGVELAPRKYGYSCDFDATMDLYALAIVLMQCQRKNLLFRIDPKTVIEIEEDIEKALNAFETPEERHFIKSMMRARLLKKCTESRFRFRASSLINHPTISEENFKVSPAECYYLHSLKFGPMKEFLYYEPDDSVHDVIIRHLKLHYKEFLPKNPKYLMLSSDDFSDPTATTSLIGAREKFSDVLDDDVARQKKKLLVFPLVCIQTADDVIQQPSNDLILHYPLELGGCPIFMAKPRSTAEMVELLKKHIISPKFHEYDVKFVRPKDKPTYKGNEFLIKLVPKTDGESPKCENRFAVEENRENDYISNLLQWDDVAQSDDKLKLKKIFEKELMDAENDEKPPPTLFQWKEM